MHSGPERTLNQLPTSIGGAHNEPVTEPVPRPPRRTRGDHDSRIPARAGRAAAPGRFRRRLLCRAPAPASLLVPAQGAGGGGRIRDQVVPGPAANGRGEAMHGVRSTTGCGLRPPLPGVEIPREVAARPAHYGPPALSRGLAPTRFTCRDPGKSARGGPGAR